jgi:CRP-like cAMP-binding protein
VDEISAEAGETIMRQGDPGYEFVMIEEGTADVFRNGERVNTVGPGDFCGELAILGDGVSRTASVVATSDLRGLVLTAHFMREMRERLPSVGARIDQVAAEHRERDMNAAS